MKEYAQKDFCETNFVYYPYIPLQSTPTIDINDIESRLRMITPNSMRIDEIKDIVDKMEKL